MADRAELAQLFEETVALYLRLSASASAIYRRGAMSGPRRTLLMSLSRSGAQTVAHLARARSQSRQRLQPLVNALIAERLVERLDNPAHKRSPLVVLTPRGERVARQIAATEAALRARLRLRHAPRRLAAAAAVLRDVRAALDHQLRRVLRDYRRARPRRPSRI